jgi:hypothetical protein
VIAKFYCFFWFFKGEVVVVSVDFLGAVLDSGFNLFSGIEGEFFDGVGIQGFWRKKSLGIKLKKKAKRRLNCSGFVFNEFSGRGNRFI